MIRTVIGISGIICSMCEAHISEAIRNVFPVRKAAVSRKKGNAVILSEESLDETKLRQIIRQAGYVVRYIKEEKAEKKGLMRLLNR